MIEKIAIVGAGGFGREVEWLIKRINQKEKKFEILGYIDDGKEVGTKITTYNVIANMETIDVLPQDTNIVIAIGNPKTRKNVLEKIEGLNKFKFPNLIDPSAIVDIENIKGKGNIICAGTIATVNIKINNFNIINLDCTIGHDVIIKDFITLYPSVNVSGNVEINNFVEIGTGTQIIQGKKIESNIIVGAGAVVVNDLIETGTYIGVPTKKIN